MGVIVFLFQESDSVKLEANIRWAEAFLLVYSVADKCSFDDCNRLKFLINYNKRKRRISSPTSKIKVGFSLKSIFMHLLLNSLFINFSPSHLFKNVFFFGIFYISDNYHVILRHLVDFYLSFCFLSIFYCV